MKKLILTTLISLISVQSFAVTVKLTGPCSKKPLVVSQINANLKASVGEITEEYLKTNNIEFIGGASGFASIGNSPVGLDAVEVVSEGKIRAYGWCYTVNGMLGDVMPDKLNIQSDNDVIEWFYGFSTLENEKWSNEPCTPGYKIKAAQFCK